MEVDDIDIRVDKTKGAQVNATPTNYVPNVNVLNMSDRGNWKGNVWPVQGNQCSYTSNSEPSSDTESEEEEDAIPTIAHIVTANQTNDIDLIDQLKSVFTQDVLKSIEVNTRGQSENPDWFTHRHGRITASLFPSVLHFKFGDSPDNYIVKSVLGERKSVNAPSLAFGKQNEPVARQLYFDKERPHHKSLKVENCGLFVDEQHPYMGASPDGIVSCSCCGEGLIEINVASCIKMSLQRRHVKMTTTMCI